MKGKGTVKIFFIGDIVGQAGRKIVREALPVIRAAYELDLVIANAENSAGGSGLSKKCHRQLAEAGIDAITMGDHIYRRKEIIELFGQVPSICRPVNYPDKAPGPGHLLVQTRKKSPVAVVSVIGRIFMKPVECPFRAMDRVLEILAEKASVIIVDVHAEATSEKQLLGRYLAGRVSAVLGTHTHVPTADAAILPPGTAYITDVGMTGPYDSVIGRRYDRVLHATLTFEPVPFDVATGDPRISGVLLEIDDTTGRAISIELLHLDKKGIEELGQKEIRNTKSEIRNGAKLTQSE